VQINGNPHAWLEDRAPRCTLIIFVDATSRGLCLLRAGRDDAGLQRGLHSYVNEFGVPLALYSDRHNYFGKHDPEDPEPTLSSDIQN
jgi:hypothetical protein